MGQYPFNASQEQVNTLRELARRYTEMCADPRMAERRELWRRHNNLEPTRVLFLCSWLWASNTEKFLMKKDCVCQEGVLLYAERWLRNRIYHFDLNDDMVFEPWLPVRAIFVGADGERWGDCTRDGFLPITNLWGEHQEIIHKGDAWMAVPFVKSEEDILKRVKPYHHQINEAATAELKASLEEIFDGTITISMDRRPIYASTYGGCDISEALGKFIGIENLYYMVYEDPDLIHALASHMQRAVLTAFDEAEKAGDFATDESINSCQGMPYCEGLRDPEANGRNFKMKDMWLYTHAQEFTAFSPQMHKEFLLDYQKPILEKFGLSAYGCCEDLGNKIDILRSIKNLRRITVSPVANVRSCAEQIGTDYILSWRPNPTSVVLGFDDAEMRKELETGLKEAKGCHVDFILKDITGVSDTNNLKRWSRIARETAEKYS